MERNDVVYYWCDRVRQNIKEMALSAVNVKQLNEDKI